MQISRNQRNRRKGVPPTRLDGDIHILAKLPPDITARKTEISGFSKVDVKEAVNRDLSLRYDETTGYLGTAVTTGKEILKVSPYDRIIIFRKSGVYTIMDVPDRLFVDTGMWYCGFADKELLSKILFTAIYKDEKNYPYIKRARIEAYILNRDYLFVPDNAVILYADTTDNFEFTVQYTPKPRIKKHEEKFKTDDYPEKGLKTLGVRLAEREAEAAILTVKKRSAKKTSAKAAKTDEDT